MANANDPRFIAGRKPVIFMGDLNGGDTPYKDLFRLPGNCVIVDARIIGGVAASSNAWPTMSVGVSPTSGGAGTEYLNAFNMGSNFQGNAPWQHFGSQNSNSWTPGNPYFSFGSNSFWVSGQISATGSSGAGPWTVVFEVIDV